MDSQTPNPNVNEINKTAIKKGAISLTLIFVIMVSVLLLTAGRWNWWEAWAYAAMSLVVLISSRAYLLIKRGLPVSVISVPSQTMCCTAA